MGLVNICHFIAPCMGGPRRSGTGGPWNPHWQSQVAIGFLQNSGTDPLEKQLDPLGLGTLGSNCSSREICTALSEICWWLKSTCDASKLQLNLTLDEMTSDSGRNVIWHHQQALSLKCNVIPKSVPQDKSSLTAKVSRVNQGQLVWFWSSFKMHFISYLSY